MCMDQNAQMIQFSIVIPAYNAENTIDRLFGSIMVQREFVHEVILVDDWSTDRTIECAERYKDILPLKIIQTPEALKRSPGNSRQAGLDIVTGDWVVFADADDAFAFFAFDAMTNVINDNPGTKMVIGSFDEIRLNPYQYLDNHYNTSAWVHGKAFYVPFIREVKAQFPKEFYTHEDKFFVTLLIDELAVRHEEVAITNAVTYLWVHKSGSITGYEKYVFDYDTEATDAEIIPLEIVARKHHLTPDQIRTLFNFGLMGLICEIYNKAQCFEFRYGAEEVMKRKIMEFNATAFKRIKALGGYTADEIIQLISVNPEIVNQHRVDSVRTMGEYIAHETIYDFIRILEGKLPYGTGEQQYAAAAGLCN